MSDKDQLIASLQQQVKTLTELVQTLTESNEQLNNTIRELQETIRELQRRLNQNSHNSSFPPSSDKPNVPKPKSQRKSSGKKPGGQEGHTGANMDLPHAPDHFEQHLPEKCKSCPHLTECLASKTVFKAKSEKRYEVNAVVKTDVTEHSVLEAEACPCGETGLCGEFPANIKAYIQYGDSITILAGILSTYGAVSIHRIHVILSSLLAVALSPGTIHSMISRCAKKVGGVMEKIRKILAGSEVAHFDETGADVNGKTMWIHNSSTNKLTYQTVSKKRGKPGMEENGVLPDFSGIAIHDCWAPYWRFDGLLHGICNIHLLRELTAVEEFNPEHTWASQFKELLLEAKGWKETARAEGKERLMPYYLQQLSGRYNHIMEIAEKECPLPTFDPTVKKTGRKKKGKERSLIERLIKLKDAVCLFAYDFRVPFGNNQAEQDVRNVKTKLKVAGCFRTTAGTQAYLDIMSYLSTGRKHDVSCFDALTAAFNGNAEIVLR